MTLTSFPAAALYVESLSITTFCLTGFPEPFIDAERKSPHGTYGTRVSATATATNNVMKPLRPFFTAAADGGSGGGVRARVGGRGAGRGGGIAAAAGFGGVGVDATSAVTGVLTGGVTWEGAADAGGTGAAGGGGVWALICFFSSFFSSDKIGYLEPRDERAPIPLIYLSRPFG